MKTLRGITWQNPHGYDPLVAAANDWLVTHPGVEIIWKQQPWYKFEASILGSLAVGDGAYDLIMFDHPWVGKLASGKWLMPWDQLVDHDYIHQLRERIVSPSMKSYELDGHLWALPLDAACNAALLRADLVDEFRFPVTWEQVADWAREYHDPPHQYGLVLSLEGVLGNCLFLSLMAGLGLSGFP